MGFEGLREFIDLLDREGELARVRVPVDLDQELGAVCVTSLRGRGPALLFEHPRRQGYSYFHQCPGLAQTLRLGDAVRSTGSSPRVESAGEPAVAAGFRRQRPLPRGSIFKAMTSTSSIFRSSPQQSRRRRVSDALLSSHARSGGRVSQRRHLSQSSARPAHTRHSLGTVHQLHVAAPQGAHRTVSDRDCHRRRSAPGDGGFLSVSLWHR